jgi:hypothetical protein
MADLMSEIIGSLGQGQGASLPWGWGTVIYYWLASIASFTFITAFVASLLGRGDSWAVKWVIRLASPIAIFSLIAEATELGNPAAIYWIFSNMSSYLAIDAASAVIFILALLIYAFVPRLHRYVRGALGWIVAAAATVWLIGRTGLLITASTRPFLALSSMPALLLISSVMLGMATLALTWSLGAFTGRKDTLDDLVRLNSLIASSIPVFAFILGFQILGALYGGETLTKSATLLISGASSPIFWTGVILGLTIPCVTYIIIMYGFKRKMSERAKYAAFILATTLLVVGMLLLLGALFSAGLRTPLPGEA